MLLILVDTDTETVGKESKVPIPGCELGASIDTTTESFGEKEIERVKTVRISFPFVYLHFNIHIFNLWL